MKNAIKYYLKDGIGIVYSVKDLAELIGHTLQHETGPAIRKAIRELIEDGCPIGANTNGYFWIRTKDQLEDYLSNLQGRCDALQNRIASVTKAYNGERKARHLNPDIPLKDRCRYFVIYLAEEAGIPYQAVWALAYRKFTKMTGVDTACLPNWYKGSVLNFIDNKGLTEPLYVSLCQIERAIL